MADLEKEEIMNEEIYQRLAEHLDSFPEVLFTQIPALNYAC